MVGIYSARTKEDVLAVVRSFKKFERKGRVGFSHDGLYGAFFALLGVSALIWLVHWAWPGASQGERHGNHLFLLGLNAAVVASPLLWAFNKDNRLDDLSDEIAEKWLWLDHGLVEKSHMAGGLWARWHLAFGEFSRGAGRHELMACVGGKYKGAEHKFDYAYTTPSSSRW